MIKEICLEKIKSENLGDDYLNRLKMEFIDLEEQNAIEYFEDLYKKCKSENLKLEKNQNNLLVPYLLGIVDDFDISQPPVYVYGDWPDIDIDFLPEVQKYLKNEWAPKFFGDDYVCNIATYNTLGIKQAIQDVARVYSLDRGEIIAITTSMADKDDDGNPLTWDKALEEYPEFADYCKRYPEVASAAKLMIHRNKAKGVHPGGIIISGVKLTDFVPIETDKNGVQVSAWPEGLHTQDLQPVGLIKFDLLVVKNNKQVAKACDLIKKRYGLKSICALEGMSDWTDESYLNDPKAIAFADKGDLKGVFQFDSEGIRNVVKKAGVNSFEDLVALTALYRPGPMSMLMDKNFINRKRGLEKYELHPILSPILSKTYGVMCVHEDVKISCTNGLQIPIKFVSTYDKVHSINLDNYSYDFDECHGCGPTRFEDGLKITLFNGLSVIVTKDHKVLTFDGYKEAKDLDINLDLVACPNYLKQEFFDESFFDATRWLTENPCNIAYLIGQIIGDGNVNSSLTICVGKKRDARKLKSWILNNFKKVKVHEYLHTRCWYLGLSFSDLLNDSNYGNRKTKFGKLLDDLELRNNCYHKRIPKQIFLASEKIKCATLAGLIDSDGHINKNGMCNITSCNNELLEDIRHLCLTLGLICSVANNRVFIWNTDKLKKITKDFMIIKKFKKTLEGNNVGHVSKNSIYNMWNNSGLSQVKFAKKHNISRTSISKNRFHNSNTYLNCGGILNNLLFYRIKSIDVLKEQQFYGMSVAKNHNFVANGIVLKNCYQEQVMQILNKVGLIPLKDCETVRKAISKKKIDKFIQYKNMFIENGQKVLGFSKEKMEEFWDQIEAFAGYGFNRCLSEDTLIFDRKNNVYLEIKDAVNYVDNNSLVLDCYENGRLVSDEVEDVFEVGQEELYEVKLENEFIFKCTMQHKFICDNGKPYELSEILNNNFKILCIENMQGSKVKLIKSLGKKNVYNVSMKHDPHNYLIFDKNKKNAVVSLNSHAVSYTVLTARLLWLKAHYPLEFYTGILYYEEKEDKMREYKIDAKHHSIIIQRLDLNKSDIYFNINDDVIYFGFSNVKGIGEEVSQRIVDNRPYNSIQDFFERFGTDASVLKPLIALGAFDSFNQDRLLVYKYYEYYKDFRSKILSRKSRYEKSLVKQQQELESLLVNNLELAKFDNECYEKWKQFDHTKETVTYEEVIDFHEIKDFFGLEDRRATIRFVEENPSDYYPKVTKKRISKYNFYNELLKVKKKREKSIDDLEYKLSKESDGCLSIEKFDPSKVNIDDEYKSFLLNKELAEKKYYGFAWEHPLEKSPDYHGGLTIEKFLLEAQTENLKDGPIEVVILSCQKKESKKGLVYYTCQVEDENSTIAYVTFWQEDYDRFKYELIKGNFVRMRVSPPFGKFSSLTFYAPSKRDRHKLPKDAKDDLRLIVLRKPKLEEALNLEELEV